ncbi:putative flavin-containing amine oxidase [Nemania abortiva]|nr:putative flavin-containing amine oxidase [Nemania abortiva]
MQSIKLPNATSYLDGRPGTICVIGAGVSGLRAAGLLAGAGFQSDELGGLVDLGASWIHGTKGNPLVTLAGEIGSTIIACGAVDSIFTSNGHPIARWIAHDDYQQMWYILNLVIERSRKRHLKLSSDAKMMDFFRKQVDREYRNAQSPEPQNMRLNQIIEMWGAFMGDDCERQSLKNLWLDSGLAGRNLFVASTYQAILVHLQSMIDMKATIRLQCEVTRLINNKSAGIDVEAADGFRGQFDNVVVTAPLGWLKRNPHAFSPPLSPSISNAVRTLGYGNLDKVFIKFPRPFQDNEHTRTGGDQGPSGGRDLSFSIKSLFLNPHYAPDTNPAKWRQEIISFSSLPHLWAMGQHITGLVRELACDSKEYYRILDENFRPYYSKLPGYTPDSPDCTPLKILSTDWQNDKFVGYGSFTNLSVGCDSASEHFEALKNGMGEERGIWFAGEHTSGSGGLGTVHGAYLSGEYVAKRIASCYSVTLDGDGLS